MFDFKKASGVNCQPLSSFFPTLISFAGKNFYFETNQLSLLAMMFFNLKTLLMLSMTVTLQADALYLARKSPISTASPRTQDIFSRVVYAPTITSPSESNGGTIWKAGSKVEVTWDASNPPSQITNPKGRFGFDLTDGSVEITVPTNLEAGRCHFVVLLGDSGNRSKGCIKFVR
ncbi:hypothetical protein C8J56DRAFT_911378 [Mycena floridula]|nr:hypothetical protein C8J56DRAFT_911378 [Mycena floridula]